MKKRLMILLPVISLVFLAGSLAAWAQAPSMKRSADTEKQVDPVPFKAPAKPETEDGALYLGDSLNKSLYVNFSKLFSQPEKYLKKNIMVKGKIVEGCHHEGAWIRISQRGKTLDVFSGGKWRFPTDCKQKLGSAMGQFVSERLTGEKLAAHIEHLNAEHGGQIKAEDYPDGMTVYKLIAAGAEIHDIPPEPGTSRTIK